MTHIRRPSSGVTETFLRPVFLLGIRKLPFLQPSRVTRLGRTPLPVWQSGWEQGPGFLTPSWQEPALLSSPLPSLALPSALLPCGHGDELAVVCFWSFTLLPSLKLQTHENHSIPTFTVALNYTCFKRLGLVRRIGCHLLSRFLKSQPPNYEDDHEPE